MSRRPGVDDDGPDGDAKPQDGTAEPAPPTSEAPDDDRADPRADSSAGPRARASAPRPQAGRRVDDSPLIPDRSADDSDVGWNDAGDSNDERLRRDVPPHW